MVGRHLALGRVEPELLEEAGDDQERPVLSQDLQDRFRCILPTSIGDAQLSLGLHGVQAFRDLGTPDTHTHTHTHTHIHQHQSDVCRTDSWIRLNLRAP